MHSPFTPPKPREPSPHSSAIPDFYYFCFGAYEPFLTTVGFLGTLADPVTTHNSQAPWVDAAPYQVLPTATFVSIVQLSLVCSLLGLVNMFVLYAVRTHLRSNPALQEKIVTALLTPLLFGDVFHLSLTLWALGEQRWAFASWSPMLWTTVILGLTLMIPRILWHAGVGRYVESRDGGFHASHVRLPTKPKN